MNSLKLKTTTRRSLLLIFWALLPAISSASSVTVTPGTVEGPGGGKVRIPIKVEDAIKLGTIQMELLYDPEVLEYYDTRKGTFVKEVTTEISEREPGRLFLLSSTGATETISGNGALTELVFRVKGGEGAFSPLTLLAVRAWYEERADSETLEMNVSIREGHFTVNGLAPPVWPWIAAGAAVLVLSLGIAWMVKRRRNRTGTTESPSTTVSCHECGSGIANGAKFCPECGIPVREEEPEPGHCAQCDAKMNTGARFCQECGHPAGKPALQAAG